MTNTRTTYQKIISYAPTSVSGTTLYLSNNNGGDFEINTNTYALQENAGRAVPNGQPSAGGLSFADSKKCSSDGKGTSYCFNGGNPATVVKTVDGQPSQTLTISLGKSLVLSRFVKLDTAAGLLYVTGYTPNGRGADAFTYFEFTLSPFAIKKGPVSLEKTEGAGCPVTPRQCGVPVLLYMDANNGILSYVYSVSIDGTPQPAFQINLVSYSDCGYATAQFDDINHKQPIVKGCSGSTPTTAPTKTSTCPSNCGTNPCCDDIRLGQTCYNPATHHCVTDSPSGHAVLCGKTDNSCASYCYDPSMYQCKDGKLSHL
jgi:hypothetical protein